VSLLLILLIHYLYAYLKNAVTIPIVDDSLTRNKKRYDDMLAPVPDNITFASNGDTGKDHSDDTIKYSMKDELQSFLNELKINVDQDVKVIGTTI